MMIMMEKVTLFNEPDPDSGIAFHIEDLQRQNCLVDVIDNIEFGMDGPTAFLIAEIYYRKPEKEK